MKKKKKQLCCLLRVLLKSSCAMSMNSQSQEYIITFVQTVKVSFKYFCCEFNKISTKTLSIQNDRSIR